MEACPGAGLYWISAPNECQQLEKGGWWTLQGEETSTAKAWEIYFFPETIKP